MADANDSSQVAFQLQNGSVCLIDAEDYKLISDCGLNWRCSSLGYAVAKASGHMRGIYPSTLVMMHRLILGAQQGDPVDHINGNTLDNRRCNLRICTHAENMRNQRKSSGKSKYKGVTVENGGKRIRAKIRCGKVEYKLGDFRTEEAAARAYDAKAIELHGEFACTNADLGLLPETTRPMA